VNVSAPFIQRPVATTLLAAGLALAGVVAFHALPVSPLPQVDFPTIMVSASLPGASPETMASSVATPLERQFGRIAGLAELTSTSSLGSTQIVLQFDLDRNIDGAARDVQAAINAASSQLPSNLPNAPTYRKVNPAEAPVLVLALTSDTRPISSVFDAASSILQQKLSQVDGVGQVLVGGGALPAVRVELNPAALSGYAIGLDQVRTALATANANRPKGQIADVTRAWTIRTTDQLFSADEYKPLVVAWRNGSAVRLSDVASVEDSVQDVRTLGLANGKRAVSIILFRQPAANIVQTVDNVRALLPELQASIPADVNVSVVNDRTTSIRASTRDGEVTLILAIGLVVLVVFVFLRNGRATFIPAVAVPLSLAGTFVVMYLIGYSLDTLSMMALTISTGFVIDDAIVVIENTSRHRELGLTPMEAALEGSREVGFTVLSMSTSLIAVFIPILLMGGIVGRLFREFAVTLSAAIAVSMLVSLTTTPMLCATLLKPEGKAHGRLYLASERAFDAVLAAYARGLRRALAHPRVVLALLLLTVVITLQLYRMVPKGFFPQEDTGLLTGNVQARQDISFQAMRDKVTTFASIVGADPAVDNVVAFTGGGGATNTARFFVSLKPLDQRRVTAGEVMARLRSKAAGVPGARLFLQPVQDIRVGGRAGNALYQFTLRADSLEELARWTPRMTAALGTLPELADLNSDEQNQALQATLDVDRDSAARLGLTMQAIDASLGDAFGQSPVSTIYTPLNQYRVVMENAPSWWQSPDALKDLNLTTRNSAVTPLMALASYQPTRTALAVSHQSQFPSNTLSFNVASDVSLGAAVNAVSRVTRDMGLPATVQGSFQGTAQAFQDSLSSQPFLIGVALVAVFIVLGVLYESYVHPITILSTLPPAGIGALLALMVSGLELSVIAIIGIILLIGIVKKNAIMLIDFALDAERREGKTPEDAIYEACLLRFRPIMMTTMAALLGAVPVAFATGIGVELRRPLGIAIVGGLIVSQMLTLFTTPILYLYLNRVSLAFARTRRGRG
jgi:multidrug efflux pump